MSFFRKKGGHYSVRRTAIYSDSWKIVIAYTDGSSYDDVGDTEYFSSFEKANHRANQLNKSAQGMLHKGD